MPKVSVIVPVYNTESYIGRCLDSILAQNLEDIEVIIVNDGSTDNSLKVINEYCNKDRRIKLINQENQGLGPARNSGIKVALGEYVAFIDSDDWIEPEMLENMYNVGIEFNSDIVACNFRMAYDDGSFSQEFLNMPEEKVLNINFFREDFIIGFLTGRYSYGNSGIAHNVTNKIFRLEFLKKNSILFERNTEIYAEDEQFTYRVLPYVNTIAVVNKPLYNYFSRTGSIMLSYKPNLFVRFKELIKRTELEFQKMQSFNAIRSAFKYRIFIILIEVLKNEMRHHGNFFLRYQQVRKIVTDQWFRVRVIGLNARELTLKGRVIYMLYRFKLTFLTVVLLLLDRTFKEDKTPG